MVIHSTYMHVRIQAHACAHTHIKLKHHKQGHARTHTHTHTHKQYTYIKLEDTSEKHFFSSGIDDVGDITNQTVEMEQEYIHTLKN